MSNSGLTNFHLPRWNELPNLDLYLDQLVTILDKYLKDCIVSKEETIITKTMINNYVKQGLIKPPKKKKYSRLHIATLIVICILKQIYSINDINELMLLAIKTAKFNSAYDQFCEALENAISYTFEGKEYKVHEIKENAKYEYSLLKSVAQSFASKLYVEKTFLRK